MYTRSTSTFGDYHILTLTNTETGEYVSVLPELGARVYQLGLKMGNKVCQILDCETDPHSFKEERWYRGVILAPFSNRVKNGKYDFEGTTYQLPINFQSEGHAIHGLMYNKVFVVEESLENELVLTYVYDGSNEGYPFPLTITYTYSLHESDFAITVKVKNCSSVNAPFGVGWHPYFDLKEKVDYVLLQLPTVSSLNVEAMIPTGEKQDFRDFATLNLIGDTGFDTGFIIHGKGKVSTVLETKETHVEVWQSTESGFKYLQIFTPPGRSSIAIEPMTCPTDAFNSKESLIILKPEESWSGSFGVTSTPKTVK